MNWLRSFGPLAPQVGKRELWLASLGAGLGVLAAELLSRAALGGSNPWFLAPMGASAVLLFAVPASPLAQPWALVAGNLTAGLIGVASFHWLGATELASAVALASAIAAMFALRCLHPPSGGVALTAVLGGPAIQQMGYGFVFGPVLANSVLLVLLAMLFNNAAGRRYPHHLGAAKTQPHATNDPLPAARLGLTQQDLDAALSSYGQLLDVDRGDLEEIIVRAQLHAGRRRWGEVRCRDVMSRDVVAIASTDSVDEAWSRLARHKIKALPVLDASQRLVGIVSLHDFFLKQGEGLGSRVPRMRSALRVEEIMTRHVQVARADQRLADLLEAFSNAGLHHMPVLDAHDQLVGMLTQSDVVAALFMSSSTAHPRGLRAVA